VIKESRLQLQLVWVGRNVRYMTIFNTFKTFVVADSSSRSGKFQLYTAINSAAVFLISALILIGWQFGIEHLRQPFPGYTSMHPTTALMFIFTAVALFMLNFTTERVTLVYTRKILAILIFSVGLFTILRYFNSNVISIDQWLLAESLPLNRFAGRVVPMAPNTAFNFILTGSALYLKNKWPGFAQFASLLQALVAFLVLTGYLQKLPALSGPVDYPMSIPSAVCFILVSSAILLTKRQTGFITIVSANNMGGRVARLLFPMCIVVPVLIDAFRRYGEGLGLFSKPIGIALCSTAIVLIFTAVTWKAVKFINGINEALTTEIAERKNAEESLKTANLFLSKILDNFPEMVFVKKIPELTYVNVNKAAETLFDCKEEEILSKTDYELFPGPIADSYRQQDTAAMGSRDLLVTEVPVISGKQERWHRTKKITILNENEQPAYLLGIAEDITDDRIQKNKIQQFNTELEQQVRQRTLQLSRSEQRFRALIENSTDFISMIDATGKILYRSPNLKRITGYQSSEWQNTSLLDQTHPDDISYLKKVYELLVRSPEKPIAVQYRRLLESGSYIWVEGTMINRLHDKNVRAVVANYRDITERKKQEDERETLIRELTQHNKDLRQFSYIISHNLRAPIANIMGLLSILENSSIEDPEVLKIINYIDTSTHHLDNTITDLVHVVNIKDQSSMVSENIPLSQLLEKIVSQFSMLIEKESCEINCDFNAAPFITFNRPYLESIFTNLVSNALKYRSEERLKVNIKSQTDADHVIISFTDNGSGIDLERYRERLFGLYQRFHTEQEGKGLGLFLIKSQIEALNGKIEVESQPGVGTTFILRFLKVH
jgi:PAS domain S-box-containing protein